MTIPNGLHTKFSLKYTFVVKKKKKNQQNTRFERESRSYFDRGRGLMLEEKEVFFLMAVDS